MNDMQRNALCIIIGYPVLYYAGAMFDFFPFMGDSAAFSGFLAVLAVVACTCWIIDTIKKQGG